MTGPCRQGPERRGHLRALLWPAQDLTEAPLPGRLRPVPCAWKTRPAQISLRRRDDAATITAKITRAHLNEFPDIAPALRRWKPRRRRTAPRRVTEAAQEIAALKRAARRAGTRAGSARGRASGRTDVADDAGTVRVVLALPSLDGYLPPLLLCSRLGPLPGRTEAGTASGSARKEASCRGRGHSRAALGAGNAGTFPSGRPRGAPGAGWRSGPARAA
jgi:hypothetical protein